MSLTSEVDLKAYISCRIEGIEDGSTPLNRRHVNRLFSRLNEIRERSYSNGIKLEQETTSESENHYDEDSESEEMRDSSEEWEASESETNDEEMMSEGTVESLGNEDLSIENDSGRDEPDDGVHPRNWDFCDEWWSKKKHHYEVVKEGLENIFRLIPREELEDICCDEKNVWASNVYLCR